MVVINWNKHVNTDFILNGDYGYEGDNIKVIKFSSGKERSYLGNTFVPREFASMGLILDDTRVIPGIMDYNTEFKQFMYWYERGLRYGILPFYAPKIHFPARTAVYKFIPDSLRYAGTGVIEAGFGLKEIG